MRKIKTSDIVPGVGYAPEKKGLDFLQLSFSELFYALAQTIIGSQIGLTPGTKTYILSGCQRIGTSTSAAYRPGYIYDEATQEIYHFQGTGLNTINTPNGVVLSFVNTIESGYNPSTFSDGSTKNVHINRELSVHDGMPGSADFNYSDLLRYNDDWHYIGTSGQPAFLNGWANEVDTPGFPPSLRFRKDAQGIVYIAFNQISNAAGGGTTTSPVIFTFPAGTRPVTTTNHLVYYAGQRVALEVLANGDVKFISDANLPAGAFLINGVELPLFRI